MATRVIRIVLEALSLAIVLGITVFLILCWARIPDQVPIRFDGAGQIMDWADKKLLFAHPILMMLILNRRQKCSEAS